ncbi:MAG: DUF1311 domain-containing protein [Lachnospiraceae bacterium]|nr:DUF1311 domain-containing protein [Lachnospiraceae bacterium]
MNRKISLAIIILTLTLLTGCNGTDNSSQRDSAGKENPQGQQIGRDSEEEQLQEPPQSENQQPEMPQSDPQQAANAETEFDFDALTDRRFDFSSGAGAWNTELFINSDGTFKGLHNDSDMGDMGTDYPNGTIYYCSFTGKFDNLEKVDEFTYKMKMVSLLYEDEPGKEEIIDGVRYVYSTAYGLTGGTDFYLYLPGAKLEDLPEGYRGWVGYYYLENTTDTVLPYYGLYNLNTEDGFSSSVYEQPSLSEQIAMEISFAEERGALIEATLQNASSQGDMNVLAAELFLTWDDTLNIVWKLLESELDAATMETLRTEERDWITDKDAQVKAAGQEFEGGSFQPMAESMKAAELTKERVYELAEYAQ